MKKPVEGIKRGDYSEVYRLCQRKFSQRGESVTLTYVYLVLNGSRSCNPGTRAFEIIEVAKSYLATKHQVEAIMANIV